MYNVSKATPKGNITLTMDSRQICEEFGVDIDSVVTIVDLRKVFSLYSIQTSTVMTEYGFTDKLFIVDKWSGKTVRTYEFDGGFEITLSTINKLEWDNALYCPVR